MEQLLLDLMRRLEAVGDRDESLYGSVVREKLGDPIFYLFVQPTPGYLMPDDYGLLCDDNPGIKVAMREYIDGALALAPSLGLDTFHKRLAAFQLEDARTERGNYFDDFFGWINPNQFDHDGNVVRKKT